MYQVYFVCTQDRYYREKIIKSCIVDKKNMNECLKFVYKHEEKIKPDEYIKFADPLVTKLYKTYRQEHCNN